MYNNLFMYQNLYRPGLFSRAFRNSGALRGVSRGLNWSNILSTTQKSLGIINQAIPIVNQVRPIINNAKTMFKIADILKDNNSTNKKDNKNVNNKTTTTINSSSNEDTNKPIFYI